MDFANRVIRNENKVELAILTKNKGGDSWTGDTLNVHSTNHRTGTKKTQYKFKEES